MYLDTAIIVKLLVREPDSTWFDQELCGKPLDTSELAIAEVQSALLGKERAGSITLRERNSAMERFRWMIAEDIINVHKLNLTVLERAASILTSCHPAIPLRTLDAIHVATANLHRCHELSTTDQRLRAACERLAISLLPRKLEDLPRS